MGNAQNYINPDTDTESSVTTWLSSRELLEKTLW